METRKPYRSLAGRVGVGLGLWAVGVWGLADGYVIAGQSVETKIERYGAELNADDSAWAVANNILHQQQTRVAFDVTVGIAALAAGTYLARGAERLWSGPVAQSQRAAVAVQPTRVVVRRHVEGAPALPPHAPIPSEIPVLPM